MIDKTGEIDGAEEAGAIGRQGLLAARIGGLDRLAIGEIVLGVDAVDEDHPRLGGNVGGAENLLPQLARLYRAIGPAGEYKGPAGVRSHRIHECIGDQDREVEHAQP